MATDLYKRMIEFNCGDKERGDLMRKVWAPTPWMTDAYTGDYHERRQRDMLHWLHETFGDECSPIHERRGRWQRGSATVHGWTWFGFAAQAEMNRFVAQWPTPDGIEVPANAKAA